MKLSVQLEAKAVNSASVKLTTHTREVVLYVVPTISHEGAFASWPSKGKKYERGRIVRALWFGCIVAKLKERRDRYGYDE